MIEEMNILIAGVGGQGALTLTGILADAAMKMDIKVVAGEVHGMAQRGGSVFVHLRMGKKVYGPIIPLGRADVIVSLEMVEALRYLDFLSDDGTIIVSKTKMVPPIVWSGMETYPEEDAVIEQYKKFSKDIYLIDSLKIAKQTGNPLTANIVLLGSMSGCFKLPFEKDVLLESLTSRISSKIRDVNIKAFEIGWQEAKHCKL